jgi:hypothetical protein
MIDNKFHPKSKILIIDSRFHLDSKGKVLRIRAHGESEPKKPLRNSALNFRNTSQFQ